ncbi:uncharacterized protein PITG_04360 [Phytophthora infestans T30-4]|uniref:M96 mating-specific protein family n=1 Tax=Phytophthora infestans (strain T30-4) TaxID=403677 RepID=D0N137_PHYIT|nr:uncharacterized protein PITG_04360 [Phytophthora infestans T30-4]EEY67350.1 conserved hypothetical protein [Phytophthora infestans T30-4]|eukprot:XP_002905998.1 conserved hypothetical protein [Phytophthora infestans T30-4]
MNRSTKASRRPTRGRKRVSDVPYSTELLRRKRVEAQTLLLEVQTLSTHLATLQEVRRHQINAVSTTTKGSSVSVTQWRGEAAIESEKRCRAEKLNRELKVLLAEQMKLRGPILKALEKTDALQIRRKTPTPLDMNAEASIVEGQLCNNAVATFRKYDEGDRIILVGTTKWFRPSGELLLQDYNWTVISQSPITPLEACVARHCYKLEMTATSSIEASRAQKLLFHIVSSKMRCLYQDMQDVLLNSVDLVQDAS